jgi:hypothetical protein
MGHRFSCRAIIVFAWQAASWMFLGIHDSQMKYTAAQDQVMNTLSSSLTEDGMYFLPTHKPGASNQEQEDMMKQYDG